MAAATADAIEIEHCLTFPDAMIDCQLGRSIRPFSILIPRMVWMVSSHSAALHFPAAQGQSKHQVVVSSLLSNLGHGLAIASGILPGLDIRSNGAYVIAPGSVGNVGAYGWVDVDPIEPQDITRLCGVLENFIQNPPKKQFGKGQRRGPRVDLLAPIYEGNRIVK